MASLQTKSNAFDHLLAADAPPEPPRDENEPSAGNAAAAPAAPEHAAAPCAAAAPPAAAPAEGGAPKRAASCQSDEQWQQAVGRQSEAATRDIARYRVGRLLRIVHTHVQMAFDELRQATLVGG